MIFPIVATPFFALMAATLGAFFVFAFVPIMFRYVIVGFWQLLLFLQFV